MIKKYKIFYIAIILILFLFITSTISFGKNGTVNTNELRLRAEPNTTSQIITYLYVGNEVEILETSNEWYKISYQGNEGYVRSDLLDVKEDNAEATTTNETPKIEENASAESETNQQTIIYPIQNTTKSNLKIYILPLITSTNISNIEQGKTVTVNQVVNNWAYISYENSKGWVRNALLQSLDMTTLEEKSSNTTITKGYINVSAANLRKTADTAGEILTTVALNTEVNISGEENGWYKVTYGQYNGYILKTLISETTVTTTTTSRSNEQSRTTTKTGYISVNIANIRTEANTKSTILTKLNQKDQIEIVGEENDFYKININNQTGYVAKRLTVDSLDKIISNNSLQVTTTDNATSNINITVNGNLPSGSAISDFAKKYLGYSYVWGGKSPSTGFDCGGFTSYVYSSLGYTKYTKYDGIEVAKTDLQPGDLIYFNNAVGHVGIYVGNGQFIHAANAERGVVIDTMTSGYYSEYYSYAKRMTE